MTNIDESATNDTEKEELNLGETSAPSDYLDELAQKDNFSIYPDEDVSEVEDRFFGNNKLIGSRQSKARKVSVFEKRRRVKLQARRVRRIVRHIEVWSVLKISILLWSATLLTLSYWEPPSGKKIVDFDPTFIASIFSASTAALGVTIGKKGNNKKDVIVDNKNTKSGIK